MPLDQDDTPDEAVARDNDPAQEGEIQIQPLPQDNGTPFSPPTDPIDDASEELAIRTQAGQLDPTHQVTDTNVDSHQRYDEGLSGAAEASEPNAGDAVVGYTPLGSAPSDATPGDEEADDTIDDQAL